VVFDIFKLPLIGFKTKQFKKPLNIIGALIWLIIFIALMISSVNKKNQSTNDTSVQKNKNSQITDTKIEKKKNRRVQGKSATV